MRRTFRVIELKRPVMAKCKKCGRRFRRIAKVYQTMNPWNQNERGIPRNESEIREALRNEIVVEQRRIVTQGIVCRSCELSE